MPVPVNGIATNPFRSTTHVAFALPLKALSRLGAVPQETLSKFKQTALECLDFVVSRLAADTINPDLVGFQKKREEEGRRRQKEKRKKEKKN